MAGWMVGHRWLVVEYLDDWLGVTAWWTVGS